MDESQDFFKDIIENLYDGVYFVNRDRVITYWNQGAERITGYPREQVLGHSCKDNLLNHVDEIGRVLCCDGCPLAQTIEDGKAREADVFLHHADGHRLPVLVRVTPLKNAEGEIIGAVEIFTNDAGIKTARLELRELRSDLLTDALTGIGNRRFLESRLRSVMTELKITPAIGAGLLFFDIDNFKAVNDTYGHDCGDKVLRMTAMTLKNCLRKSDGIGRWGGEEFVAILYGVPAINNLVETAEKMRILIEKSRLDMDERHLSITVSIGATMIQPDETIEAVIQRADELMYRSKKQGKNRISWG